MKPGRKRANGSGPQAGRGERGIAIYITAALLVMAIPMIGLTFDGTMLFIIKARLQGAVDGAALAGSRSLARGSDADDQTQAAQNSATAYVKLNYPGSFFFSSNVRVDTPSVDLSVDHQRSITVVAHADYPALFMSFLGFGSTTVTASAQAIRRDVNVVLVLDRSGSMTASGSCNPMKQAAINFLSNFAPGRDNVGLITFATTTTVHFQTASNFTQAGLTTILNSIVCDGSTSSAMGLWTAYDELVRLNSVSDQTGALNFIVFFTDGEPTGVAVRMPLAAASPCTQGTDNGPGNPKTISGLYAVYTDGSAYIGLASPNGTKNGDGTQILVNHDQVVAPNSNGCAYAVNWFSNWSVITDFRGIPTVDIFGNALVNNSYKGTTLNAAGYVDIGNHNNGIPIATNAADDAARRIRIGASDPNWAPDHLNNIIIDAIGLGNAPVPLPADGVFLERVTNDPRSPIFDSTRPKGLFVFAQESSDISSAFSEIASEILRLAR